MIWLDSITDSMDMNLSKLWETVTDREAWHTTVHGSQRVRHDLAAEQQEQRIKEDNIENNTTNTCGLVDMAPRFKNLRKVERLYLDQNFLFWIEKQ